jgi:hypothetical protein
MWHANYTCTVTYIFRSSFNLRFGFPRSDTCQKCDSYYVKLLNAADETERNKILTESELHHRKAEKSYSTLKEDSELAKNNSNLIVLTTDLQQVLFTPSLTHSNVFYQRQYSCYNYCVHDAANGNATMHLWHETVAKRGSAEIASCLLLYIVSTFLPLAPGEHRKLVVWSDRCVGQNNNFKMVILLKNLVSWKYFTEADHKFLCSGHSFLPCDREFAFIERQKKISMVYVPFDWVTVIANARPSKPFHVRYMTQKDFKNFDALEKSVGKPKDLKITEAMWIHFTADDPTRVYIRKSHNILQSTEK